MDRKDLERLVSTEEHITWTELPGLQDLYTNHDLRRFLRIMKDSSHPHNSLEIQTSPTASIYMP